MYVDILLTGSDSVGLLETKQYLKRHFVTKSMERRKYFLGIEVAHQKHSILLSQRNYALDLFEEAGLLGCKPATTSMEANVDLWFDNSDALDGLERYKKLIEKLIYLTVTRPNITFVIGVLSRFMLKPRETYWLAAIRVLAYINSCPKKGLVYKEHGHVHIFGIQIQDMLVTKATRSLLLGVTYLLKKIWCLEE